MVELTKNVDQHKKLALLSMLSIIALLFISAAVWLMLPKYQVILERLDEETAATAINKLEQQGVPFRVNTSEQGSSISVESTQSEQLRVTLANQLGLPEVQGLELFDNADYSMTDFSQDVTYKRAIQGELARTIASMPGVKSARVHVTFSPKRLFRRDRQAAKAAVYVEQLAQVSLTSPQVKGIQKLVANAIENLIPNAVAVFDQDGVELSVAQTHDGGINVDKKYQAKQMFEEQLTEKAYRLLTLSISPEKIAVSVDVTLNFDQRKKMRQGYAANADGEGVIVKQRESSVTQEQARRIAQDAQTLSQEKETEFRHGQETEETVYSSGEIKNIHVGVALREDLTAAELLKVKEVLSAGLGINEFRGDKLAVEVINFGLHSSVEPALTSQSTAQSVAPVRVNPAPDKPPIESSGSFSVLSLEQFSPLWLLFALLLIPVTWFAKSRRTLGVKKRQQLLVEVKEWLEQEEQSYGKL